MQVYIVGGAVRDQLLNRPSTDKDFVVVGTTPQEMQKAGFIQVGADFPVFLHPKTKAEYALARTERKSGKGYKGFEVYAAPEVTLEQDLLRRDLTINAMAIEVKGLMDDTPITGKVIDPYDGLQDLKEKTLRHVSDAFSEDPLRVLRIARFYSRFYDPTASYNFTIASETLALIETINNSDELQHLTSERVWQETSRALMQPSPQAYFDCLIQIGSLPSIMPSLAAIWNNSSANIKKLVFRALSLAGQFKLQLHQRWAILMLSFAGKNFDSPLLNQLSIKKAEFSKTDSTELYNQWSDQQKQMSNCFTVPKRITQFVQAYINCYPYFVNLHQLSAQDITTLISSTKAQKNMTEINELITLHHVIQIAYQQIKFENFVDAFNQVSIQDIDSNLQGSAIGEALNDARINSIEKIL